MIDELRNFIDGLELSESNRAALIRLIAVDSYEAQAVQASEIANKNHDIAVLNAQIADLKARYNAERSEAFGAVAYEPPVLQVISYG